MNKITIAGIYKGEDDSIMICGTVFNKNTVIEGKVTEDLFLTLKSETEKNGWFTVVSDNYDEYLTYHGRGIVFRDAKVLNPVKEAEKAEEVIIEPAVEEPKAPKKKASKKKTEDRGE
ncbi:MAG: hypothetical protein RR420_00790 [Anaerovoracaceae bacterium]